MSTSSKSTRSSLEDQIQQLQNDQQEAKQQANARFDRIEQLILSNTPSYAAAAANTTSSTNEETGPPRTSSPFTVAGLGRLLTSGRSSEMTLTPLVAPRRVASSIGTNVTQRKRASSGRSLVRENIPNVATHVIVDPSDPSADLHVNTTNPSITIIDEEPGADSLDQIAHLPNMMESSGIDASYIETIQESTGSVASDTTAVRADNQRNVVDTDEMAHIVTNMEKLEEHMIGKQPHKLLELKRGITRLQTRFTALVENVAMRGTNYMNTDIGLAAFPHRDKLGRPISSRGLPRTPWTPKISGAAPQPPEGPDLPEVAPHQPTPPTKTYKPQKMARSHGNGGGGGSSGSSGDDSNNSSRPRCRHTGHNGFQPRPAHHTPRIADNTQENNHRRRIVSTSLYYTKTTDPLSNKVAWLANSIDGPYAGKHDRLSKGSFHLDGDTPQEFFAFYVALRSFLNSCGFHIDLLPMIEYIRVDLQLGGSPIDTDMPPVGAKHGGERMPSYYWNEQHRLLGSTLYALFSSKDIINGKAKRTQKILAHYLYCGDGFKVLQDMICLHHPGHVMTRAPAFRTVRDVYPIMGTTVAPKDQLDALTGYYMDFSNWETHLRLYPESNYMRGTEFHLLFIGGLTASLRQQVHREETDLRIFQQRHRPLSLEPDAPEELHAHGIYDRLSAAVAPLARETQLSTAHPKAHVSSITLPDLTTILGDIPPEPERVVAWCAQLGDSTLTEDVVAAFQRNFQRKRQPQAEKRPASLCPHLACSKTHTPDDCCLCFGQRHSIGKCWHIIGLPSGKQNMCDTFKQQFETNSGPWKDRAISNHAISANDDDPCVSSIVPLPPDHKPDALQIPSLRQTGVVMNEAEGDLHDVKEMDHGFASSFILHHLANTPHVSAAMELNTVNLPEDGAEVSFISRVNRRDTVVAHVDTGATVMVTNIAGELHGTIPTKALCGTAMTGSKASIDALGTWMLDLVGSTEGKDLPLAFKGATQITSFQRRSLSLHSLKDQGYACAHTFTHNGNFLEIMVHGKLHIFPLLTINGSDYVEMRVHRAPPLTTVAAIAIDTVARLDLAKNFKADGLYHLLHLRYGCPGRKQMELILKSSTAKGVPANVGIPEFFRCPICDKEKTNSLPRNGISDKMFLPIGVRFHADFGFYKQTSVRGFNCFLLVTEAVTGYKWTFCRRSKQSPINLVLWFMRQLRQRLGVTFAVLRTDGGGELWGCHEFRNRLLQQQCIVEPTGAYNSSANGQVERGIGTLCVQTQICLYASGMDVTFWCFAMSHAALLCNIRPRLDTLISSHESLFKKVPNYANLAIWGSPIYVVDRRLTRRRPDSATITGRFLGYAGSHHIVAYKNDITGSIQYAHHTAIDELDLKKLPGDRNPAAKFLSGIIPDARHEIELRQAISELTPTLSPWLSDNLVSHHVPYDVTCTVLGIVTEHDRKYDRLRLVALTPGSTADRHLARKHLIGYYVLAINGIRIRSTDDIQLILHDYHDPDPVRGPAYLTGVTILFGITKTDEKEPEQIEFSEQDHATARVVWSIIATDPAEMNNHAFACKAADDITAAKDDALMLQEMFTPPHDIDEEAVAYIRSIILSSLINEDTDVPFDELVAFVKSIIRADQQPVCPKFWHTAMKDPGSRGKWIEAMFKHLDSCYAIGTFGPPRIPPNDVTVLPAVIVLKMIVNAVKQINARKVRVCAHGGHQEQGRDFEESFAHTVLGRSIKIGVAVSCYLMWLIFHFDIHNAFQTCPDDSPASRRTWLRINQTWLDYFRERQPQHWPTIQKLIDQGMRPEDFGVEMFMFVQGRTDASRKWGELIEEFIFNTLGLLANRADPCTYSGIYKGQPVILCRATDDFLLFCRDKTTYDEMIMAFRVRWTVHALDEVKLFFGIRFICSDRCITMDQTHKVRQLISEVFGPSAHKQPPGKGYSTPMIPGTEHANELAACAPYDDKELKFAQTTTYAFVFRHILGGCMHCALWTRLDILTACLILAQYQARPGKLHFQALKHIVGYLRLHPDIPLTFNKATTAKEVSAINFELLDDNLAGEVNSIFLQVIPSRYDIPNESAPESFTSCDNLFDTFGNDESPIEDIHDSVARISPPVTECLVDANLPGGLYERMATSGGSIEMGGTTVIHICQKQTTMAESSTEAELVAAAYLGKILRWLVLFMSDLGLPFQGPIPIAEDNAATRLIAHSGKITRNVRHVAIKTLALQGLVRNQIAVFNAIGTALNRADHFTKPLPLTVFRAHIFEMMGLRFLTRLHAELTKLRNREEQEGNEN